MIHFCLVARASALPPKVFSEILAAFCSKLIIADLSDILILLASRRRMPVNPYCSSGSFSDYSSLVLGRLLRDLSGRTSMNFFSNSGCLLFSYFTLVDVRGQISGTALALWHSSSLRPRLEVKLNSLPVYGTCVAVPSICPQARHPETTMPQPQPPATFWTNADPSCILPLFTDTQKPGYHYYNEDQRNVHVWMSAVPAERNLSTAGQQVCLLAGGRGRSHFCARFFLMSS